MIRIKTGDLVAVLSGKDRGKRGKVLRMFPHEEKALVERLNLAKHFDRPTQANQAGGVIEREVPLPLAKLAVVCPRCSKPTRVGVRLGTGAGGVSATKQRVCKQCREAF